MNVIPAIDLRNGRCIRLYQGKFDRQTDYARDPVELARDKRESQRFHPPLDIVDGAARIVDPIFSGFNSGEHVWGQFLKDYRETDW